MLVDIKSRLREPEIASLLAYCVWQPTSSRLNEISDQYLSNSEMNILGFAADGMVVGCAGVDLSDPLRATLLQIAVHPAFRGRGIGKQLVEGLIKNFNIKTFVAKTDNDAVGFYRSCGFEIECLGEKYPGNIRYRCELSLLNNRGEVPPSPTKNTEPSEK